MRRPILRACARLMAAGASLAAWPGAAKAASPCKMRWVVFYGQAADERVLAAYDIVVLDSAFNGSIASVGASGARVCAYLSLGEIRASDPISAKVPRGVLLEENPAWPGTRRLDVRQPSWRRLIFEEMIPSIMRKGFSGLLVDTLDTPPYLEQVDPAGNQGMRQAAVDLMKTMRRTYPNLFIVVNRGYALLPDLVGSIDAIVAEGLLTRFDATQGGRYVWNAPTEISLQLSLLRPALQRQPPIPILSLDYWDPEDQATVAAIYRRERDLGHCPYVGTRLLDRILAEPVSTTIPP